MIATRGRRLSKARVALALVVTAGAGYVSVDRVAGAIGDDHEPTTAVTHGSWFAPYVDVTIEPGTPFEDPAVAPVDDVVLSFVVADPEQPCRPSWGAAYSLDEAATHLELDRRIERVRLRGGDVVVSFGGAANDELAVACDDVDALTDAYADVVERYDLTAVDLDVEGAALADAAADGRRAEALAAVQAERDLEVWLTLPSDPRGLPTDAVATLEATLAGGVDLAGVNLMTMDFGESRDPSQSMVEATTAALDAAHGQLGIAYGEAGTPLGDAEVWARLGATPMLGQNDTPADRFELGDAEALVDLARDRGLGRLSVWSLNRDQPCGPNATGAASPLCSGTDAAAGAFTTTFAEVGGRVDGHEPTPVDPLVGGRATAVVDDPATSPHPIWEGDEAYVAGERTVWHRNVYEAKWWNEGQMPDAPVSDEWETPWRLVGPVLPGDHPPVVELLPEGTHPAWEPGVVYHAGDLVQLDGIGYRARWWTQGEAPDADARDAHAHGWEVLSD
jgi:chitinase